MKYHCIVAFLLTFCLSGCSQDSQKKELDLFGNLVRLKTDGRPQNIDSTFNSLGYKWAENQDMEDDSEIIYTNKDTSKNDYYSIDDQVTIISYTTRDSAVFNSMVQSATKSGFEQSINGKDSTSLFTIYSNATLKAVFVRNVSSAKPSFTVIMGKN